VAHLGGEERGEKMELQRGDKTVFKGMLPVIYFFILGPTS
jgi:hypothetical protein